MEEEEEDVGVEQEGGEGGGTERNENPSEKKI